jgi:hypothetical protein
MVIPRTYATAGAFRRALEERLKSLSRTEHVDINRLRRQVSFDRLLARLFLQDPAPWVLKGGYALELRFKSARSTIDIDLSLHWAVETVEGNDPVRAIREMLQATADLAFDDWLEYTIGPPIMDISAAPYGGARYSIEVMS